MEDYLYLLILISIGITALYYFILCRLIVHEFSYFSYGKNIIQLESFSSKLVETFKLIDSDKWENRTKLTILCSILIIALGLSIISSQMGIAFAVFCYLYYNRRSTRSILPNLRRTFSQYMVSKIIAQEIKIDYNMIIQVLPKLSVISQELLLENFPLMTQTDVVPSWIAQHDLITQTACEWIASKLSSDKNPALDTFLIQIVSGNRQRDLTFIIPYLNKIMPTTQQSIAPYLITSKSAKIAKAGEQLMAKYDLK